TVASAPPRALHSFPTRRSSDLVLAHRRAQRGQRIWLDRADGLGPGPGRRAREHDREHLRQPVAGGEGGEARAAGVHRSGKISARSEEHTSELQSLAYLVCRLLL